MLFWWVTAKSSACQRQGPYSYAKQGMEVGTGAGFQMREPIYPAALNSFNIFSILCILVSHLQLCIGSWAAFRESPLLAGGAGAELGRAAAPCPAVKRDSKREGQKLGTGTQSERWTLLPFPASRVALLRSHGDAEWQKMNVHMPKSVCVLWPGERCFFPCLKNTKTQLGVQDSSACTGMCRCRLRAEVQQGHQGMTAPRCVG